jgi:hypothetical protein
MGPSNALLFKKGVAVAISLNRSLTANRSLPPLVSIILSGQWLPRMHIQANVENR